MWTVRDDKSAKFLACAARDMPLLVCAVLYMQIQARSLMVDMATARRVPADNSQYHRARVLTSRGTRLL
jgi:hypothetical protein